MTTTKTLEARKHSVCLRKYEGVEYGWVRSGLSGLYRPWKEALKFILRDTASHGRAFSR